MSYDFVITLVRDQFQASCSGDGHFVLMLFNLVLIIVKPHSVTNFRSKGELIATQSWVKVDPSLPN